MKISAYNQDSWNLINEALTEADPELDFVQFFDTIEEVKNEKDEDKLIVYMKNTTKFVKDLNHNKFVVSIPDAFVIDSFETVDSYEFVGRHRFPYANTVLSCHIEGYDITFVIVLSGFNSHCVKIVHAKDAYCTLFNGCLCKKKTTVVDDPIKEPTLEDAIKDAIENTTTFPDNDTTKDDDTFVDNSSDN